jgi:hypothetical protein
MRMLAGIDEIASETQVSEGWTYSLFSLGSVTAIDHAVSSCTVQHFFMERPLAWIFHRGI